MEVFTLRFVSELLIFFALTFRLTKLQPSVETLKQKINKSETNLNVNIMNPDCNTKIFSSIKVNIWKCFKWMFVLIKI